MLIGATPTFTLRLPEGIDLSDCEHFVFSMKQDDVAILNKEDDGITLRSDHHTVDVYLEQEDTLQFKFYEHSDEKTKVKIQLNYSWPDGSRGGTKTKEIELDENLYTEVIV